MTTGVIRGHSSESSRPFSYVNPYNNRSEPLFPFGFLGWKMCGGIQQGVKPFGFLGWKMCGGIQQGVKQNAAQQALERVATDSGVQLTAILPPMLRLIEPLVRASYPDILLPFVVLGDGQLMQLAVDTCLFLLVVFTMLLGDDLGFPSQHLLLGHGRVNEDKEMWLRSIFFVGNQIPFAMVDKLMESFSSLKGYRDRLRLRNDALPSDPLKIALRKFVTCDSHSSTPPPFDIIHCLRLIVLGPETNQHLTSIFTCESQQGTVSELSELGYSFLPLPPECGVRGIRSENFGLGVKVYLPPMEINSEPCLELMAKCLFQYEASHLLKPEVGLYLNSLCRLIRSREDIQVLLSAEVIAGAKVECLLKVLGSYGETPSFDPAHCQRIDIQSRKPRLYFLWKYKKWLIGSVVVINAVFLLASQLLQSQYTVLGYYTHKSL